MVKKVKKDNPMGYENVLSLIIKMSLPAMLSMFIQSLYNITDSYFVAQYSEKALRATSISFPIQIIITAFGVGTGVGINSYISRSLGADKDDEANQGAMHGFPLMIISWIIFILFRIFLMEPFLGLFTEDPEVMSMAIEYLGIVSIFSIFSICQVIIEKMIQATGNMIIPMICLLTGAITNIILDPIMIFGLLGFPRMGIKGAAIATIIGQFFAAAIGLIFLLKGRTSLEIDFSKFKFSLSTIKQIYIVGFPSILMQSVTALVTTILNLIVVKYSELAVSVLGIYLKLESFVFMPVFGLNQGILPIIGYNYGAKKKERIQDTYKYGIFIAIVIMIIGLIIFQVFPRQLIGIFSDNPEMIDMGVATLRIISTSYIMAAIGIINSTYFQALGIGKYSLLVTTLRQIVIIIPMAYALSFISLNAIWFAYPIAEFIAVAVSIIIQRKVNNKYVEIFE